MHTKRLSEAVAFAAKAHDGQYRKGSNVPYVSHVFETGLITMSFTDDEDVVIAALLHDVVEDTAFGLEDIREQFGARVADLVSHETEDKMRQIPAAQSWKLRKETALARLKLAPLEVKMICLADKLSNMRLSARTYAAKGDAIWQVFNQKDKREQEWYYRSIYKNIPELKDTNEYREYVQLCDEVFGVLATIKN